jgi:hypothetical protein
MSPEAKHTLRATQAQLRHLHTQLCAGAREFLSRRTPARGSRMIESKLMLRRQRRPLDPAGA